MSESLLDQLDDPSEKAAGKGRVYGVMLAIVTNTQDPEKLGRIKVNYPWLSETSESDWVRVCSIFAGKDRGGFFLPDVGDEVLVAFQQGDMDLPYVLGGLWNTSSTPPEENADGKDNIKIIKSRSGHTITISDDSEGQKELVEIKTNAGHQVLLDDAAGKEKIDIIDKTGSNKITIDSVKNAVTIESAMEMTLKSTNITIEASGNFNFKGAIVKGESSATMNLEAGAINTIKGAMVKIN